jgi:hypothetical protein
MRAAVFTGQQWEMREYDAIIIGSGGRQGHHRTKVPDNGRPNQASPRPNPPAVPTPYVSYKLFFVCHIDMLSRSVPD